MKNDFPSKPITSLKSFIEQIKEDMSFYDCFGLDRPWFRGQDDGDYGPLPSVLREIFNECDLSQTFRNRAPAYGETPDRNSQDKWLFLMQHVGAPTRLLDWTESALVALYFAVFKCPRTNPAVWMIYPLELNKFSIDERVFPNTWADERVLESFRIPFNVAKNPNKYPIAVQTTYSISRMAVQKSCFTIHGSKREDFEIIFAETELVKKGHFRKYSIASEYCKTILEDLRTAGVTYSTVFPDLVGLAKDLKEMFFIANPKKV